MNPTPHDELADQIDEWASFDKVFTEHEVKVLRKWAARARKRFPHAVVMAGVAPIVARGLKRDV